MKNDGDDHPDLPAKAPSMQLMLTYDIDLEAMGSVLVRIRDCRCHRNIIYLRRNRIWQKTAQLMLDPVETFKYNIKFGWSP